MTRALRAELIKVTRGRALPVAAAALLVAAVAVTAIVFFGAEPGGRDGFSALPSVEELESAGGPSEAFSLAASFFGFFVFVVFTANWSTEFSNATFRSLLLQKPRRIAVLGGKALGLLAGIAVLLAAALLVSGVSALAMAPAAGVSTEAWFTAGALGDHARGYVDAFVGLGAWASFGMALGVLVRSTPIALAIGIGWAGPIEHIAQNNWPEVSGWLPGLVLEAIAVGGTPDAPYARALALTAAYVALAVIAAVVVFRRRDMVS